MLSVKAGLRIVFLAGSPKICLLYENEMISLEEELNEVHLFLLNFCSSPRSHSSVYNAVSSVFNVCLREAVDEVNNLLSIGLLEGCELEKQNIQSDWTRKGWHEAFDYASHCSSIPTLDYSDELDIQKDTNLMKSGDAITAKSYLPEFPHLESIKLPPIQDQSHMSLHDMFDGKSSYARSYKSMGLNEFSWFVYLSFGQTGWKFFKHVGRLPKKTVPSGGCRHPVKQVLAIMNIEGLNDGVYYYDFLSHSLFNLDQVSVNSLESFLDLDPDYTINESPCIHILFYCDAAKSMWRYKEARSYRVLHHDLGHLIQNTTICARSLSRKVFASYTPDSQKLEPLLRLNPLTSFLMASVQVY